MILVVSRVDGVLASRARAPRSAPRVRRRPIAHAAAAARVAPAGPVVCTARILKGAVRHTVRALLVRVRRAVRRMARVPPPGRCVAGAVPLGLRGGIRNISRLQPVAQTIGHFGQMSMNIFWLRARIVGAFPDTKKWLLVTIAPKIKEILQNVTHLDFLVATQGGSQGSLIFFKGCNFASAPAKMQRFLPPPLQNCSP